MGGGSPLTRRRSTFSRPSLHISPGFVARAARRRAQTLTDVRQLSELFDAFEPFGFAMIHRSWAVNLRRVREIRPAADSGWEVKLDPPVNRVLPVSRRRVSALWECFAE